MSLEGFTQAARNFQYDYIYIDAIFVSIWTIILIRNKKFSALKFGVLCGIIVYLIDAVWWWNAPAGPIHPAGTYIREYVIGGIQMPRPLGGYFWLKFGCDFMMTFSYSLFAFPWMWIIFENFEKREFKEIAFYTSLYFGSWMLTPLLSILLPIDDTMVNTVRYMDTQLIVWIVNVFVGYSILAVLYGTNIINSKDPKIIGFVFIVGCAESFCMEFPLFIFGIRPTGIVFLIFEIFFLVNQGTPYLYILWDKILPWLGDKIKRK